MLLPLGPDKPEQDLGLVDRILHQISQYLLFNLNDQAQFGCLTQPRTHNSSQGKSKDLNQLEIAIEKRDAGRDASRLCRYKRRISLGMRPVLIIDFHWEPHVRTKQEPINT